VTILRIKTIFRLSSSQVLGIFSDQQLIPTRYRNSPDAAPLSVHWDQGGLVGVAEILAQIDREIAHLQRARTLLKNGSNGSNGSKLNGAGTLHSGKKRKLTPEGRKRISEAVRRRWARQRKAASGS
jgi:hypothetical protein